MGHLNQLQARPLFYLFLPCLFFSCAPSPPRYLLELMKKDIKPRDIMTRAAFENAMVIVMATGGSTNAGGCGVVWAGLAGWCGLVWAGGVLCRGTRWLRGGTVEPGAAVPPRRINRETPPLACIPFLPAPLLPAPPLPCPCVPLAPPPVLHLIAMARACGLDLTLDDFQRVSDRVPFIADLKPSGKFVMEDVHKVRGLAMSCELGVTCWGGCSCCAGPHTLPGMDLQGRNRQRSCSSCTCRTPLTALCCRRPHRLRPAACPRPASPGGRHPRRAQVPAGAQPGGRLLPHRHRCGLPLLYLAEEG